MRDRLKKRADKLEEKMFPLQHEFNMVTAQIKLLDEFDIATGNPMVNQLSHEELPLFKNGGVDLAKGSDFVGEFTASHHAGDEIQGRDQEGVAA